MNVSHNLENITENISIMHVSPQVFSMMFIRLMNSPRLLRPRRKRREPQIVVNAWEWRSAPADDLMEITVPEMEEQVVMFPLHSPLVLDEVKREDLLTLKRETEELKALVNR